MQAATWQLKCILTSGRCMTIASLAVLFNFELKPPIVVTKPNLMCGQRWHSRTFSGARIAGGRGSMIGLGRRPKQFSKDRFQTVRPDLIALNCGMKTVNKQAGKLPAILVSKLVIDVQETDFFSIGPLRHVVVNFENRRHG